MHWSPTVTLLRKTSSGVSTSVFLPLTTALLMGSCVKRSAIRHVVLPVVLLAATMLHAGAQSGARNLKPDEQTSAQGPSTGRYYALVIGINAYPAPIPPLKTAVHDAEDVARVLHDRYGFDVELLRNGEATREGIFAALARYEGTLSERDNLLIYYAGHGFKNPVANKSYWLPANANSSQSSNRISADDLTTEMFNLRARHVLIISDSCYSGGLTRDINDPILSKGQDAFLRKMLVGRSRNLMASGHDEPVADGGPDGHSIFAYAVLKALEGKDQGMFTASDLFYGGVQRLVAGNSDQVPQYTPIRNSGDEAGDFVFKLAGVAVAEEQHRLAAPAIGFDRALDLYQGSQFVAAAEVARPTCESGDVRGCNVLAVLYENGKGVGADPAQAVALYRKACDGGYAPGCSNLGFMYTEGKGIGADPAHAVAFYRKGCDGGDAHGCSNLGVMYAEEKGVAADPAQAVALYRKACDGGYALGCTNLGFMYTEGKGVDADPAQAVAFYRKACDGGDAHGCSNLGVMYAEGKGVAADPAQAVALYRKACDGGYALGCTNLGFMYADGQGVAADPAQALALYRKACDGGDAHGCSNLASVKAVTR